MQQSYAPEDVTDAAAVPTTAASWYMLGLLFFVYMFSSVDRMVIGLIVEPLKAAFHIKDSDIGLLSGLFYSLPFALCSLPMGLLVDKVSRTKLLGLIVAVWSVMTAICALAGSFVTLAAARMAVGASEAGAIPASLSLLSDAFPPKKRGAAVGIFYAAGSLAQFIVFLGGAWVLASFGWHAVFLIAGLPGLMLGILLLLTAKEPARGLFDQPEAAKIAAGRPKLIETLRLVIVDAPIRYTVLANMIATGVGASLAFWAVSFFVRGYHMKSHQAATIIAFCLGAVAVLGALISGPVIDRLAKGDPRKIAWFPAVASALAALAGLAMVNATSLTMAIAAYAVTCFMIGAFLGPGNLLLLGVTPSEVRGSVASVNKLISILIGSSLFPWITGAVSDHVGKQDGIRVGLLAVVCFFLLGGLFFALAGRSVKRIPAGA